MSLEIRFYTRHGCHLCRPVQDTLEEIESRYPVDLKILHVDEDPELEALYGRDVPVVEVRTPERTRTFRHHLDPGEFEEEIRSLWNR